MSAHPTACSLEANFIAEKRIVKCTEAREQQGTKVKNNHKRNPLTLDSARGNRMNRARPNEGGAKGARRASAQHKTAHSALF